MTKFLFSLLLVIASHSAMAEWVKVVEANSDNLTSAYIDPASVSRHGYKTAVWTMLDFSQLQTSGKLNYYSMKSRQEYDCKKKKMRILETSFHTGNMAAGNMIYHSSATLGAESVTSGNMIEDLWEYACAIRLSPGSARPEE